jgi:O-antigen ligase
LVTHAFALHGTIVNQTIPRVPLTTWSAIGFAIVICSMAFLGARRSPWVALLLAFSVPFAAYRDIAQTTLTVPKCVVLGSAVGLLLSGLHLWPRSLPARRLLVTGFLLLAAIAASSWAAADRWLVAREFFKQAEYVVLLWCAVGLIENVRESGRYLALGVLAGTLVVSSFAIIQMLAGGAPSGVLVNGHVVPRAAGMLEGPNQLAGFLEAALPLLWISPLIGVGLLPFCAYDVAASTAALILSQSRAGIVMATVAYALLWRLRRAAARWSLAATAVGALCGAVIVAAWLVVRAHASFADLGRFFLLDVTTDAGGVGTRAQLWPAAIALFRHHPILGVGAGNFSLMLPSVGVYGVANGASSLWLQTLAEQGVVGFVVLAVFSYVALRETYLLQRDSAFALVAFLATVSLLAHQLVDNLFFFPKVAGLFWLLLGAGTATPAPRTQGSV